MSVVIKHMANLGASTFTMIFLRTVLAVLLMLPFMWMKRRKMKFGIDNKRLFLWRSLLGFGGMLLMFYSVMLLPVNTFVALSFIIPIFASLGAVLVLGEKMGIHRWGAVFVGFGGMLIIVQPEHMEVGLGLFVCLAFCLITAVILLMVKKLSASEDTFSMMFYLHLWMGYMSIPLIFFTYHELTLENILWGAGLAIISIAAHYSLVRSYTLVDLTLTAPFEFSRILMASGFAYAFLGEIPEQESYIGAAIIVASAVYIARREAIKSSGHLY
jgi:drug/metabolite transporter (DMT)-like permease